jgi:hypothetical protein
MATESPTHHAPVWLFSFVDLAFLLLIAMTQLDEGRELALQLGEIVVPRIHASAEAMPSAAAARWQLRIHPSGAGDESETVPPFELVLPGEGGSAPEGEGQRLAAQELRTRLAGLRASGTARPLLAPHADSRSQDLLEAVGILEDVWPERRRATVVPDLAAK